MKINYKQFQEMSLEDRARAARLPENLKNMSETMAMCLPHDSFDDLVTDQQWADLGEASYTLSPHQKLWFFPMPKNIEVPDERPVLDIVKILSERRDVHVDISKLKP